MKVSVAIVTYNHERYISKALNGVLSQNTKFEYEIVVGDDCSTDNTSSILVDYQKRHPDRLRLLLNEKNIGGEENIKNIKKACKGEYIAFLDGDDYWTSPDKLQKQVDFLDNHPECSECFHDSLIIYEDCSKEPEGYVRSFNRLAREEFSLVEDILLDNFIPSASAMYRRDLAEDLPDWIGKLKMGDWPFHVCMALKGNIGFINETMAVYFVHPGGLWSMKDWQFREFSIIELFEALGKHLDPKYDRVINRMLRWKYFCVSAEYEKLGNTSDARTYAVKSFLKHLKIFSHPLRHRIDADLASIMPTYLKSESSIKLLWSILRLSIFPVLKKTGPAVLKPLAPRLYDLLRARITGIFKI
jgi:glycosyltransferase involved in cell wall biosynthesis